MMHYYKIYAATCVYHCLWKEETHGKANHVTLHDKRTDNQYENNGYF
jgi:hypothetical protein